MLLFSGFKFFLQSLLEHRLRIPRFIVLADRIAGTC